MHESQDDFVVKTVTKVSIPADLPPRTTTFDVFTKIGSVATQLAFTWEPFHLYYYIDVLTDQGFMRRIWPRLGLFEILRNFDPLDPDAPDAMMFFGSATPDDRSDITPDTLESSHFMYVALGEVQ